MKKRIILLFTMLICCLSIMFAQNDRISYQAVVRDSTNHLVVETPLTVEVKLTDADNHTYSENHSVTSNPNGLISLWIGNGYNPIGNWDDLKWNSVTVESKIYRQSDSKLIAEHTLPLAAVPYALYAENVNKENLATNIEEYFEEHPMDQVQSDWEENDETSKAYIFHKPEIPVVNDGLLTIQFNGQEYTFTANQAANTTVDLGNAIAEPQVQSDWEETDPTSKAYILHKPDINDGLLTIQFAGQEYTFTANQAANTTVDLGNAIEVPQVQSDWEETDPTSKAYILHKPDINDGLLTIQYDGHEYTFTANQAANTTVDLGNAIAEPQVQSDWEETDPTSKAYILHKPDINDGLLTIHFAGQEYTFTANQADNTTVDLGNAIEVPQMTAEDLIELVNGMTDEQKAALRTALGMTGGGSEPTTFTCGTDKLVIGTNEYETVLIGTQCWTKTNMREAVGQQGTSTTDTSSTAPYYYVNSSVNATTYGYYYNWPAANQVCPEGWHLPNDAEWTAMEATQTSVDVTGTGWRGNHAGRLSGEGWPISSSVGNGAPSDHNDTNHNASDFSVIPAGNSDRSSFSYAGSSAYFWSSTEHDTINAWGRVLIYNYAYVNRSYYGKYYGYSVRCLRD